MSRASSHPQASRQQARPAYFQQLLRKFEDPDIQMSLEALFARLRFVVALIMIDLTALACGSIFEPESPLAVARRIQENSAISFVWKLLPAELLTPLVPISDGHYFRYLLPPIGAVLFIVVAGGFYVKDIYNLPRYRQAVQYVSASLFGFFYPRLEIDAGRRKIDEGQTNILDAAGGPGFVLIQPGNAATFRHLRWPSRSSVTRSYFMIPFEQIGYVTSLDDQHGFVDKVGAVTRDGIQVAVRKVHFRYRIKMKRENGSPARRTLEDPYPFEQSSMLKMAYNLNVDENGQASWSSSVQRAIINGITDFIASNTIDYLTAPGRQGSDPRNQIRRGLFGPGVTDRLSAIGTELLWVDFGHIEIVEEEVDQQRIGLWSVDWIGNANRARALGEATRQAVHELGRAESNALLIVSIADALSEINIEGDRSTGLRKLLLVRTAQVLESWSERNHPRS
jgi:hypothetical protein